MNRVFLVVVCALLAACGGGAAEPVSVAFYGDSITEGRTEGIAKGAFLTQDFAIAAQDSDAPLDPRDTSPVTVLRYGMADIVHNIPPGETRTNLLLLVAKATAMGHIPVVVNVSYTESGMEQATNEAIAGITTIDVRGVPGATVDGIHPTEDYHERLNQFLHERLVEILDQR